MKIYLITDEHLPFDQLLAKTKQALEVGIDYLQYRAKDKSLKQQKQEVSQLKVLCKAYQVPLIINDHVSLAKELNLAGVHLGQGDGSVTHARAILGPKALIGVTAKTEEQAKRAWDEGADYLGVGALYPSPTKTLAKGISLATLQVIKEATPLPIYGIGGLKASNITPTIVKSTDGLCFVSAIYQAPSIEQAIQNIQTMMKERH